MLPGRCFPLIAVALLSLAAPFGAVAAERAVPAEPAATAADEATEEDVISLAAYNVKADRIEDFGLRIASAPYPDASRLLTSGTFWFAKFAPLITSVVPNTAAARAGLQPGERILKSDGQSTVGGLFSTGKFGQWAKSQKKKWAEVSAGKTNVAWTLEVESLAANAVRTVRLVVPTPPPHWGASVWRAPEGRKPSTVAEAGPLAERSRAVLDNGIATLLPWPFTSVAGDDVSPRSGPSVTGYEWHFENEHRLHRIVVTQIHERTRVFFETVSPSTGRRIYLTSPSGALAKAWRWGREENIAMMKAKTAEAAAKVGEVRPEDARVGFEHELDLWTTKVRKLSPRWPFEVIPGYDPDAIFAGLAAKDGTPVAAAATIRPFAAEFLKLPPATDAQRALFADAYGRLGADADQWAYTETSHSFEDNRAIVTRVDPSKPEAERCVLLSIDGKAPTPDDVQRWRDNGGDTPKALGDLPPLASIVDLKELRIAGDEAAAVMFELPVRAGSAEFPAENFQALFRVNKAQRACEEIAVKLRDSFRVAGVVKITEAGMAVQFQVLDPALAPQPARLKMGGGVRVLLVKVSRSFDSARTDFQRVEPFDEPPAPAK